MSDEAAPTNQSAKVKRLHDEGACAQPSPPVLGSDAPGRTQINSTLSSEISVDSPGQPKVPKLSKQALQAPPRRQNHPSKKELQDPKKFNDEIISWCIDNWLARARVVYQNGDIDGTSLWSPNYGQEESGGGFNVFDGFDRTWYVPTEDLSPLPESKKSVQEQLEKRNETMKAVYSGEINTHFITRVKTILEQETGSMCQNEWDCNRNNPVKPPMEWLKIKSTLEFFKMVKIVAKTRLLDGRALLPEYYRVSIVELTAGGKLFVRQTGMPSDIDFEGVRLRLDAWSPADDDQSREPLDVAKKKVDIAIQCGTEMGKQKAAKLLREMTKSVFDPLGEGGSWLYKLHVKENYTLPQGKGPGKMNTWPSLKDYDSLDTLIEGYKRGKNVVLSRQWKIRLRIIWPQIIQLEQYIVPITAGEPQLTDEQYGILDQLLAEQGKEEREEGSRLACVLNMVEKSTHRPEFEDK